MSDTEEYLAYMRKHAEAAKEQEDSINHPSHYTQYKGVEVIDLTEQMNFNKGNAVKYICRAGFKDPEKTVEDLKKAVWYLNREIARISNEHSAELYKKTIAAMQVYSGENDDK